eukprot:396756-Rhodomonas_salina.1
MDCACPTCSSARQPSPQIPPPSSPAELSSNRTSDLSVPVTCTSVEYQLSQCSPPPLVPALLPVTTIPPPFTSTWDHPGLAQYRTPRSKLVARQRVGCYRCAPHAYAPSPPACRVVLHTRVLAHVQSPVSHRREASAVPASSAALEGAGVARAQLPCVHPESENKRESARHEQDGTGRMEDVSDRSEERRAKIKSWKRRDERRDERESGGRRGT